MCFAGNWQWLSAKKLQGLPVGLSSQVEFVFHKLHIAKGHSGYGSHEGMTSFLADGYGIRKSLGGRCAVPLLQKADSQCKGCNCADRQVIRSQILQRALRLKNDRVWLVLSVCQGSPVAGNTSYNVPGFDAQLVALQSGFTSLK